MQKLDRLQVGDVLCIPEIDPDSRFLVTDAEPPGSVGRIDVDSEGLDKLHGPATLREDLRTFYLLGHWPVEQALLAWRRNTLFRDSDRLEPMVRASYEQPPYEVPRGQ